MPVANNGKYPIYQLTLGRAAQGELPSVEALFEPSILEGPPKSTRGAALSNACN